MSDSERRSLLLQIASCREWVAEARRKHEAASHEWEAFEFDEDLMRARSEARGESDNELVRAEHYLNKHSLTAKMQFGLEGEDLDKAIALEPPEWWKTLPPVVRVESPPPQPDPKAGIWEW